MTEASPWFFHLSVIIWRGGLFRLVVGQFWIRISAKSFHNGVFDEKLRLKTTSAAFFEDFQTIKPRVVLVQLFRSPRQALEFGAVDALLLCMDYISIVNWLFVDDAVILLNRFRRNLSSLK